jgi:peroxiredoxin
MIQNPGLPLGAQVPDFTLPDFFGKPFRMSEALARGPLIVVLFRGGWCPYCNTYLRRAQEEMAGKAAELGAGMVAISSDAPGVAADVVDKQALAFPVLSDPPGDVLGLFNAANALSPEEYAEEKKWHDIEAYSLNQSHVIAVPGVLVLGRDAKVAFCELNLDLSKRPDPQAVLKAVRGL